MVEDHADAIRLHPMLSMGPNIFIRTNLWVQQPGDESLSWCVWEVSDIAPEMSEVPIITPY